MRHLGRNLWVAIAFALIVGAGGSAAMLLPSPRLKPCHGHRCTTSTATTATTGTTTTTPSTTTVPTTTTLPTTSTVPTTTTTPTTTGGGGATYGPIPQSCSGVNVTPTSSLPSLVASYPSGTTFCLQGDATHPYLLSNQVHVLANDQLIGQPGVVLDGQNTVSGCLRGSTGTDTGAVVKSVTVQNCAGSAIQLGNGARIEHVEAKTSQVGVELNYTTTLSGSFVHDNRQYGITGGPGPDIVIDSNELASNNTSHLDPNDNAGGSKIVGSQAGTTLTWSNNYVHDNYGNGIWSDSNVHGTYTGNLITHNTGAGIDHEISWDANISGNTLIDNQTGNAVGQSCWHGGQIDVTNSGGDDPSGTSRTVEVYGNTVTAGNGTNAICGIDSGSRSDTCPCPARLANLYVHDNYVYVTDTGLTGVMSDGNPTPTVRFENDHYFQRTPGSANWDYMSGNPFGFATWQSHGFDLSGTVGTW